MNYKRTLSKFTGNYRTLDKRVLAMKKSWDDVEKLISNAGTGKQKKAGGKNKK